MAPGIDTSSYFLILAGSVGSALLGGWHCLSMCGAIASANCGPKKSALYQLGRLIIYLAWGSVAGWLGSQVLGQISREHSVWALVLVGLTSLWLLVASPAVWTWQSSFFKKLWALKPRLRWVNANFLLGLFNGLIPCGWLYAFVLVAAGTGSPQKGGLILFGLWVGALPWLSAASLFSGQLQRFGAYEKWVRLALASVIIVTLFMSSQHLTSAPPSCH